jgi:hypothetical protein
MAVHRQSQSLFGIFANAFDHFKALFKRWRSGWTPQESVHGFLRGENLVLAFRGLGVEFYAPTSANRQDDRRQEYSKDYPSGFDMFNQPEFHPHSGVKPRRVLSKRKATCSQSQARQN